jgi:hypothetical protein
MNSSSLDGHRRAAVFVDFENVYLGLCASSREAGYRFATQPGRWVDWLENVLGPLLVDGEERPRKLLRRVCYLDPARSSKFRPYFTRAGFRVVDCPALTSMGKNSADIYMVLDILDTLTHPVHYDEFIVLSADADFTPVLLRLREHDRRSAMLVASPAAAAMQAACDFAIPDAMFLDEALGLGDDEAEPSVQPVPSPRTAEALTEFRQKVESIVRRLVAEADEPIAMARAAHEVRKQVGRQVDDTGWGGAGSFGKFVAEIADEYLWVNTSIGAGWLYDPARHTLPQAGVSATPVGLPEVAVRVCQVVGTPMLSTEAYICLFDVLASEARAVADRGQAEAERTARDVCAARGNPVPRNAVHFVLLGYRYSGVDWTDASLDAADLARVFVDNVLKLAADAQMSLTAEEQDAVRAWVEGSEGDTCRQT